LVPLYLEIADRQAGGAPAWWRRNSPMRLASVLALALGGFLLVAAHVGARAQGEPITLEGTGQTATPAFFIPAPESVATFTHRGSRNFIVQAHAGERRPDLLINTIGAYEGQRPILATEPIVLDIQADGPWTIYIEPIADGGGPSFSGRGDAVSPRFTPPSPGAWEITHDGQRNFVAWGRCAGGSVLAQNEIGPVVASRVLQFRAGPCFWEVQADGAWSLTPR